MKVHTRIPTKEIVLVRPDSEVKRYELYMLYPIYLGSAEHLGPQKVRTDSGQIVENLHLAAREYIDEGRDADVIKKLMIDTRYTKKRSAPVRITGTDLVDRGLWAKFKTLRRIGVTTTTALGETYTLSPDEAKELGL